MADLRSWLRSLGRGFGDVAERMGWARVWRWAKRWRRVLVPVLAVLLSLGTVTLLVVLSQNADADQTSQIVRGYDDDRCVRQYAADASRKRTALVDAQASVTGDTFESVAHLSRGLIAGLLEQDDAAALAAVDDLEAAIAAGQAQQLLVAKATTEAFAAEDVLTKLSVAATEDRDEFERLCRDAPR